ncbi:MAG TPA: M20/M25/M40 family metallo-hydrolase [Solirubrobacteraceae bacterium]|nr:M20/M25/M40 family metallo-hydrolase [Solirubrobacteraceae bacterium]
MERAAPGAGGASWRGGGSAAPRATAEERERLNALFAELCAIPSPFGRERAVADRVAAELRAIGLAVEEDDAGAEAGSECGNLLARTGEGGVLLCAHLDTVGHGDVPIEPVLVEDGWENAHAAILGADNKAAVAVMLVAAGRARAEGRAVELLFTVCEEIGLAGAKAFDVSRLRSRFGYVYDHATPIGEIVMASPTYYKVTAEFHGTAAHAGIRPEEGRSAIVAAARAIGALDLGRLDAETTANVGTIEGGAGGTNVVPERCRFLAEARSLDARRAEEVVARMVDRIQDAANDPACDVDVDVDVERLFRGYRHPADAPQVLAAERALQRSGYRPRQIVTGGGSDANALEAKGFPCTNLANGTERNHEPTERVSVAALEGMLDVTLALLEECA